VLNSLKIITSDYGVCISPKRITLSTAGVVPEIYKLADDDAKVKLAISLHAPDEDLRKKLMPVTNKYSLKELLEAAKYYAKKVGHRVTFEYILIKGVNDSEKQSKQLARLIADIPCKINLIMYNPIADAPFERPSLEQAQKFREILYPRAPAVTLRISKGVDIAAACGQLKTKVYKKLKSLDFQKILHIQQVK
jgi:23S rRNA (adenine2503-C2)-methyltransferase